jgi:uncharacterized protein (DUF2461 family)
LRDAIAEDPNGFVRVVRGLEKKYDGLDDEAVLKRMPRGFSEDHKAAKWLRYQSFTAGRVIPDAKTRGNAFPSFLEKEFVSLLPLVRWLNGALGLPARRSP